MFHSKTVLMVTKCKRVHSHVHCTVLNGSINSSWSVAMIDKVRAWEAKILCFTFTKTLGWVPLYKKCGQLRVRIPWMLNWAAVVCCWKTCVSGSTRACVDNITNHCCGCVSPLQLHFFVGIPCTRWTVTEPPPHPVLWCVGGFWLGCARRCGLGLSVERGSGHSCVKRHRP